MMNRIPATPPHIKELTVDSNRPLFSVMIPTYNCINFLKEALLSVLAQDEGEEKMQIEVIDDCSTDGDVYALVQELGKGRVGFYRQPHNVGSLRNFETCINRARGHYIHLLHGDDMVRKGFYKEIESLFKKFPECGAAFTGHVVMDEYGNLIERKSNMEGVMTEAGIVSNWLQLIAQKNRLQPPAKVVKRSVYEKVGSFFAVHFGEDWEMWVRIAAQYPVCYSPKQLAMYRVHTNNITSKSILSGQNIIDLTKVMSITENYLPEKERKKTIRLARRNTSVYIAKTAGKILRMYGHPKAALMQAKAALKMSVNKKTVYFFLKAYIKAGLFILKAKRSKSSDVESKTDSFVEVSTIINMSASFQKPFEKVIEK